MFNQYLKNNNNNNNLKINKKTYVISYHNCPKNSRETCLKSNIELLVHSCGSTGFMKLSKDSFSDD